MLLLWAMMKYFASANKFYLALLAWLFEICQKRSSRQNHTSSNLECLHYFTSLLFITINKRTDLSSSYAKPEIDPIVV